MHPAAKKFDWVYCVFIRKIILLGAKLSVLCDRLQKCVSVLVMRILYLSNCNDIALMLM